MKYQDDSIAYYYDIKTKERTHPWNKFGNRLTDDSIAKQVMYIKQDRFKSIFVETIAPILFGVTGIILLIAVFVGRKKSTYV